MSGKQKKSLVLILFSAVSLALAVCADKLGWLPEQAQAWWIAAAYLIPYLLVGGEVVFKAIVNILHGQVFDECFLMALASIVAFSLGDYPEAVIVMLFYQTGELFQSYAVARSRASIAELMNIRPEYANIEENGSLRRVDPSVVSPGEIIVVKPGERIPLDGTVTGGSSSIDTSALTGEPAPRPVTEGSAVLSGCINQSGMLHIRVTKPFSESAVVKILELVENSADKKSKAENFITVFARYYTPAVVLAALLLAVTPPLIFHGEWNDWIMRALTFLVISCPCALVISVPLTFYGGIGGASKRGILIKGGNYIDALSKTDTVVFDKTGTLTRGAFRVTQVNPAGISADALLMLAAAAEAYSDHPIAQSVRVAAETLPPVDQSRISSVQELAGRGVSVLLDGETICAGNQKLMEELGVSPILPQSAGTVVHVAKGGVYCGNLVISDEMKPEAAEAVASLKSLGVRQTVMLTGDAEAVAEHVAAALGIDKVVAGLLPDGKVAELEALLAAKSKRGRLAFVGDGINDAPSLAIADIGIAMGALGSDAAIEASDVVLTDDNPQKIATAIKIARKTMRIAIQNIVFSLGVKAVIMAFGAAGLAGMWLAVFADVGVCIITVLNALRAMRTKEL